MKVWILTAGSYSDESICGVFSSLEKAKEHRDAFPRYYNDPEEFEVDEMALDTRKTFQVETLADGSVQEVRLMADPPGGAESCYATIRGHSMHGNRITGYVFDVFAHDASTASRIAADRYREAKALNRLPTS